MTTKVCTFTTKSGSKFDVWARYDEDYNDLFIGLTRNNKAWVNFAREVPAIKLGEQVHGTHGFDGSEHNYQTSHVHSIVWHEDYTEDEG